MFFIQVVNIISIIIYNFPQYKNNPVHHWTRHRDPRSHRPLCRENTSDHGTCHRSVIIDRELLFAVVQTSRISPLKIYSRDLLLTPFLFSKLIRTFSRSNHVVFQQQMLLLIYICLIKNKVSLSMDCNSFATMAPCCLVDSDLDILI